VGRLKTAFGWRVHDRRRGRNRVTRASVRGTTRSEISCARGGTRCTNSEEKGKCPG
jgi:hypothetical protein